MRVERIPPILLVGAIWSAVAQKTGRISLRVIITIRGVEQPGLFAAELRAAFRSLREAR
jgi:hypothetical protein